MAFKTEALKERSAECATDLLTRPRGQRRRKDMTVVIIRVVAGFLAGIAAGILIMREVYKKKPVVTPGNNETGEMATTSRAS
jgi:hypothetical protein